MKVVPSFAVVATLTASAVVGLGTPSYAASAVAVPVRCQLVLANAAYTTCNYTAVSVNGAAVYAVVLGTAHLTVGCTVAGMDAGGLTGVGTVSYAQVGTCTAILYAEDGGKATATASVGSSGV